MIKAAASPFEEGVPVHKFNFQPTCLLRIFCWCHVPLKETEICNQTEYGDGCETFYYIVFYCDIALRKKRCFVSNGTVSLKSVEMRSACEHLPVIVKSWISLTAFVGGLAQVVLLYVRENAIKLFFLYWTETPFIPCTENIVWIVVKRICRHFRCVVTMCSMKHTTCAPHIFLGYVNPFHFSTIVTPVYLIYSKTQLMKSVLYEA